MDMIAKHEDDLAAERDALKARVAELEKRDKMLVRVMCTAQMHQPAEVRLLLRR